MNYHNFRNRIVLTAAVLGATFNATALDLPTRMVNGNVCYYYEVQPKETVYSLARRFRIHQGSDYTLQPIGSRRTPCRSDTLFPKR